MGEVKTVKGTKPGTRRRRPSAAMVRLVFIPDTEAEGFKALVVGADDLSPRRLSLAVEVTVPEDALGPLT